jgi:hypothetical protein
VTGWAELPLERRFPVGCIVSARPAGFGLGGIRLKDIGSRAEVLGYTRRGWVRVQWVHERGGPRTVDPERLYYEGPGWAP